MLDLFLSRTEAENIKERFKKDEYAVFNLKYFADKALGNKLYSVTEYKSPAASGNIHDYFSEGPYWWPDPKNPNGPYIRRDGEHNPERFRHHESDMTQMSYDALLLAEAGYYLDCPEYSARAEEILYTWCVNPDTKMNPHLEYGQAIRGITDGRFIGIIDTAVLVAAANATWYLSISTDSTHLKEIVSWFEEYLNWLLTSEKGIEELNYHNNHATWCNTQIAVFASLCDRRDIIFECAERYKNVMLPSQFDERCALSDELTRTNSFGYCNWNLLAFTLLCELCIHNGIDIWSYTTSSGKSIEKAIEFMYPYYENRFLWEYQQIHADRSGGNLMLQLGAYRLSRPEWKQLHEELQKDRLPLDGTRATGAICFYLGAEKSSRGGVRARQL